MAEQELTQRKLAGAIRRAKRVYVYAVYNEDGDGVYLEVPKTIARGVVEHMSETEGRVAAVNDARGVLYIG